MLFRSSILMDRYEKLQLQFDKLLEIVEVLINSQGDMKRRIEQLEAQILEDDHK